MTRRTATLVWAAMMVVPVVFLGVAKSAAREAPLPHLADPLLAVAFLAAIANVALSRALPRRLGPPRANDREAVAFTRILVSLALGEAGAIAPLVACMLTGDPRVLVVLGMALLCLATLYPSDRRWESLMPGMPDGRPATGRVVR